MRGIPIWFLALVTPAAWSAEGTVTVPWHEFKALYTEQVKHSLAPEEQPEEKAPVYSIETARYELGLHGDTVGGRVILEGRVLAGDPAPVPAFGNAVAITGVEQAEGATLLSSDDGYRLYFHTDDRFRLALRISAPLLEEQRARRVDFGIPAAVGGTLNLQVPDGWRLLEPPGLPQADGSYALPPGGNLSFRLTQVLESPEDTVPAVDTFSRIELKGGKYLVSTWFAPAGTSASRLVVNLPAGSRLVDTSLNASWLQESAPDTLVVALPEDRQQLFMVSLELPAQDGTVRIRLPYIEGNVGREGEFTLAQPEDGRIALTGTGYRRNLPFRYLPEGLRGRFVGANSYTRAPKGGELELALTRFDAVEAPEIVLDTVDLYTSFTDNGRALSTLRVLLPPEAGDKLTLAAIPNAEIWSLRVNGKVRQLYSQSGKQWVIPLHGHKPSLVELAYLHKGAPLGLKGRLELAIPATGLAAQKLHLAIGLAKRVELVAMEGDLVPAPTDEWPTPRGLTGTPYHFVHPFYRGEPMMAAVYYKEPLSAERR